MHHIFTSRRSLAALVATTLLAVGACRNDVGPAAEAEDAQLRVTASVVGTPVDRIVATVSAEDIPYSRAFIGDWCNRVRVSSTPHTKS